ncbi:MAG: O-methyltransferase [Anaerolineales bacterium]|jgi:predicted O-methyltransferase YrrM|nr:O-methyltransferase [Anaerolineales bacterium]
MFHNISKAMLDRMQELEVRDVLDREDGTPKDFRLRQVPPETGRFLALMTAAAPAGQVLEVGTSGGYSGMWLGLACRARGDRLITFDILEYKVAWARETFRLAQIEDSVEVVHGDALELLPHYPQVAVCFLDTEKEFYQPCYDLVVPHLVPGGLLLADNAITHADELASFLVNAQNDPRVDALVVPVGKGVLLCRKA